MDDVRRYALNDVAVLWRESGDASLLDGVAEVLGTTRADAEAILRKMLGQE